MRVLESKNSEEETIIDVRLFADDQPTEKGQAMTLSRWRILCDNVGQIDQKLEEVERDERVDYRLHLGANVSSKCIYYCISCICQRMQFFFINVHVRMHSFIYKDISYVQMPF